MTARRTRSGQAFTRRGALAWGTRGLLAAGVLGAAGCGRSEAEESRAGRQLSEYLRDHPDGGRENLEAHLTFWGWANYIPEVIAEEFRRIHPGVTFEFVDLSQASTHRKLQLSLYSGSAAPDLAMLSDPLSPRFADLGLLDLTEGMSPYRKDFPASKWTHTSRPDGSVQGVPWDAGPTTLVYRRDVFDRYGVDASSIATWAEFIEAGKKIGKDSAGKIAMIQSNAATNPNGLPRSTMIGQFEVFSQQNNGSWFDSDGTANLENGANVEALELTKQLRTEGITRNDLGSAQAEFDMMRGGEIATYIAPIWTKQQIVDNAPDTAGKWGAIELPAFQPGGRRAADLMGSSVVITNQTRHPAAAWEFTRFWLLEVEQRITSYQEGGLFENVYLPAARRPYFRRPDPFFGGDRWPELNSAVAREAPQFQLGPGFDSIKLEVETRMPDFVAGEKSAGQVLAEVDEAVGR